MPRKRKRRGSALSSPVVTVILLIMLTVLAVWWGIGGPLPEELIAQFALEPAGTVATAETEAADTPEPSPQPREAVAREEETPALEAHFLSVGKADSILILCGGESMLVDAGTGETKRDVVEYIQSMGVEKLDVVVATHPHEDHIGGMEEVLTTVGAEVFYSTYAAHTTKAYERMLDALIEGDIPAKVPEPGDSFRLGGAVCTFLTPLRTDYSEMNDTSLVLRIEYNGKSMLLTGDIESAAERDLVIAHEMDGMLSCDVLKVPHHGSNTSSSAAFLDAVWPAWAVITCGADDLPNEKAVARLQERGVQIILNDTGVVVFSISDGINYRIEK